MFPSFNQDVSLPFLQLLLMSVRVSMSVLLVRNKDRRIHESVMVMLVRRSYEAQSFEKVGERGRIRRRSTHLPTTRSVGVGEDPHHPLSLGGM